MIRILEEVIRKTEITCDICHKICGTNWHDDRAMKCGACKKDICGREICHKELYINYQPLKDMIIMSSGLTVIVCLECKGKYDCLDVEFINPKFIEKTK